MSSKSSNLELALTWLGAIYAHRAREAAGTSRLEDWEALDISATGDFIARFVATFSPSHEELLVVILALAPHLDPFLLDSMVAEAHPGGGEHVRIGGVRGTHHRGVLPTGESAIYLIAGDDVHARCEAMRLFKADHWFAQQHILWLADVPEGEPVLSGKLVIDPELVELATTGSITTPHFSHEFPAERVVTEMGWDDLVLHSKTISQIEEIQNWINHNPTVMQSWNLRKRIKPGYRALFYGPPGTGKTLTATLLGKQTGREVFRIDLSRVVSKYIGETEKNLSSLFDRARNKDWILFFDEADALFGKRTSIRDAHDKYANQEVAYLLQRIESFEGLVILATNQRSQLDDAFVRRFQSIIHFPFPTQSERHRLWTQSLPEDLELASDLDLDGIASTYELTGAAITNIVHYCSIESLADGSLTIDKQRLESAIRRELTKEGKVM